MERKLGQALLFGEEEAVGAEVDQRSSRGSRGNTHWLDFKVVAESHSCSILHHLSA